MSTVLAVGAERAVDSPPALPARYEARTYAGSGSFGAVWQIFDRWTGSVRAAKFLASEHHSTQWRTRFFHEYELLYQLRHPSLVSAFEFVETKAGDPFFTMRWVDGPTLERGDWTPDERLRILWEILDVVTFIHRQEVVHADLKAANIKLNPEELGKPLRADGARALTLLDFGLTIDARVGDQEARRGTVHYMAPEWFKQGEIDARIDYYSLGALLFELWAGRLPFDGNDPLVVIRQHLEATPPDLVDVCADVPVQVSEAVARMLAKQPEIRDRGWQALTDFVTQHFGVTPGTGTAVVDHHAASLRIRSKVISADTLSAWLGRESTPRILYLRGGVGLDQDAILQSLVPEICRYGFTPWLVNDVENPLPPGDWQDEVEKPLVPLLAVRPEKSEKYARLIHRWMGSRQGARHVAVSLAADDSRNQPLALELATQSRADACLLLPVTCIDDQTAARYLEQILGELPPLPEQNRLIRLAGGNPARLYALTTDRLADDAADRASDRCFQEQYGVEEKNLKQSNPTSDLSAMSILAVAREPVDRAALRALADINWTGSLSRWLDLGFVAGQEGRFAWARPDLTGILMGTLTEQRQRIIHRAWAEYWGSQSPEPGTDAYEHLTHHLLHSDAYRQAVRVGLDNARYWTDKHQAQRALEVLDEVTTCMRSVPEPAPSLVFELALANAEARRVLARYTEALEQLQEALNAEAVTDNLRRQAEIYKRMGDLYKSLKQSAAGKDALQEALKRYRQLADRVEVSHVLNNIGNIHYVAGELDLAVAAYEEALALQREMNLKREIASTLNNIGGLLVLRSQYDEATRHLSEAVDLKRTLDDPEELARSLNNLAVAYMETGKFQLASDALRESHGINVQSGKTGEQLFNLENLAQVAAARGEWAEAMSFCEGGLKLCDASDEAEARLPYLLVMSRVALAQGNYDLIPATLGESERILERVEDPDARLQRLVFVADWWFWASRCEEAEQSAAEVIAEAERERLPAWATRGYLARARIALQDPSRDEVAHRWLEESLSIAKVTGTLPEQICARTLLAELETARQRLDPAADHLRQCESLLLECSAKPLFLPFSHSLGHFYKQRGDLEMALSVFDTARKLATNLTCLEWIWRFHAHCGHVLLALRKFEEAVDQYRSGLVLLEHLVQKFESAQRERYLAGPEKIALAEGLRACHEALVR